MAPDTPKRASGATAAVSPESFPLQRREIVLIVAFWTFMGVLLAANRLFDPRGGRIQGTIELLPVTFAESYLWALLTPPIFWLGSRFSLDRGGDARLSRLLLFVGVGLVVAALHAWVMDVVRDAVLPTPPRRGPGGIGRGGGGGGGGGRGGGPVQWLFLRFAFYNNLFVYSAILAAGLARHYSLRFRARQAESARLQAEAAVLHAQLAEARLSALRMQLDPHFLFNTLHAISSLVERDPRGVRKMISRLSELLRHTLEGPAEQETTLQRELDLLRRYLEIMQIRFQGRLEVTTRVEPEVLDALVPSMILQPLVENAVKHGVSRLVDDVGRLEISARRDGGRIALAVRDNGPPEPAPASAGGGGGTGLTNTRARLEQLYGPDQRFELRPAEGGGMVAEVSLPYHTRADVRSAAAESTAYHG
ncbi:MAG TPA: histidine kinase [Gemmatimonadaceae bacterium]|nr:histidine kinase [Gemmatimonadaceae bacterium]